MPLSDRSRRIVGAEDLARMKSSSYLINTSRGPLDNETTFIAILESNAISGAGLYVHDLGPLPLDNAYRWLANLVLAPHLGYVAEENYQHSCSQIIENIKVWISGIPSREMCG